MKYYVNNMKPSPVLIIITLLFLIFLIMIFGVGYVQLSSSEDNCWKFAVLCDTRGNNTNTTTPGKSGINDSFTRTLSQEIIEEHCDLVLVPGDMINGWWANGGTTYEGQFNNWKKAMDPLYKNNIRIYAVRGNHEDGPVWYSNESKTERYPYNTSPDSKLISEFNRTFMFNKTLGIGNPANGPAGEVNLTYSFPHKNAFFVGLDEYAKPHRVNQGWLDDQLKNNTKPFVFVFGHEPAFQIVHPDCLANETERRNKFWDSIGQAGCQIYFCGHDHLYDRAHIPDSSGNIIYQMVVGSCGAPRKVWNPRYKECSVIGDFHNDNESGYVLVTMRNDTALIEWRAWNAKESDWATLDSFNLDAKANKGMSPWTNADILFLISVVSVVIVLVAVLWDKNRRKEFEKSLKWEGDECGQYEILVTAIIIYLAIPVVMFLCWKWVPIYHEHGMISEVQARTVVQGVTIFAIVYFITQLIERIIELISNFRPLFKDTNKIAKLKKEIEQEHYLIEDRLRVMNCLETSRTSRLWATASGLGIIFSYFFIGLFALVGITSMPHWIDVLISGIILGGGSKLLHDLIDKIEKK